MKYIIMKHKNVNAWSATWEPDAIYGSLDRVPEPERTKICMIMATDAMHHSYVSVTNWYLPEIGMVQHVADGPSPDAYSAYFGLKWSDS